MSDVGDVFKNIGQVAMGIGGAILGSVLLPGLGTGLGAAGGAALGGLGGAAGGALGTTLGSGIFKQKLPSGMDVGLSAGLGGLGGGIGQGLKFANAAKLARAGAASSVPGLSTSTLEMMGSPTTKLAAPTLGSSFGGGVSSYGGSAAGYAGAGKSLADMSTAELLAAMKPAVPTTKQIVYQGLLTGAAPAAATLAAGALTRQGPREEKEYTYEGGARSYTDVIRQRRAERAARKQALGI